MTTSVLFASVCDRLMSRVVAFMARVRLEYHTPIWGGEGCGSLPDPAEDLSPPGPALPSPLLPPPAPPHLVRALGLLTSRWPCRDFSRMRRV